MATKQTETQEGSRISQVLRKLMDDHKISEAELARRANMPQPTLHRILSSATKDPRGASLEPLASYLKVTINQLMGVEPLPGEEYLLDGIQKAHTISSLPVLTLGDACQWPTLKPQLKEQGWRQWTTTDLPVGEAYAITMEGDAMMPVLPEGTKLIVDLKREAKIDDFVLVKRKQTEKALVRQLVEENGKRHLKPIAEGLKTIPVDENNEILGVIVQARNDYRVPVVVA